MDDLIERLVDEADGYGDGPVVVHDIEGLRALLREAAAALGAAREDAERYRWLRVNEQDRSDAFLAFCFEELDAAIDAAREGRNG